MSLAVAKELKGKPIPPGATVFAKIGEAIKLNRRAYVITECLVDNNVMVVKALLDESDRYVFWFLRTQDFTELSRATTVPSLRKGDIESLVLPLAPLNEQRRIANKLDAVLAWVDACRERLDRVPAILKRFRQAVLAAATSGTLTEEWREDNQVTETAIGLIRRIAEERKRLGLPSAARVIRDEGVEVPETRLPSSWTWCRVGDIGVVPVSLRDMGRFLSLQCLQTPHVTWRHR